MSLKIYYQNSSSVYVEVTEDDDITDPVHTIHDGKNGDVKTTALYLHNDGSSALWYSNIIIEPYDLVDGDTYDDTSYLDTGWGVKLSQGGTEPTETEWNDIEWGAEISMSNIGSDSLADVATYYPFWYLITCPPNTNAQNKRDIVLRIKYTENAVT